MVNDGIKRGISIENAYVMRRQGLNLCRCGNDAVYVSYKGGWFVKCTCCETMMARQISIVTETIIPFETMEEAREAWNKSNVEYADLRATHIALTPEQVVERQHARIKAIAEDIKKHEGEIISSKDIARDLRLSHSVIVNHMRKVKERYPQVKSREKYGYYWKENI